MYVLMHAVLPDIVMLIKLHWVLVELEARCQHADAILSYQPVVCATTNCSCDST